ncbi:chorismate--pyruvate lyase family protein [Flocculibacter collagenilyticus]|uniref:chorismate--pyruvate lyase family protein n=1 Tax=Flocculibacter collagenilyticus TaxID=2744479 RepID=UPI0018F7B447|nr:chorismate lyase [Flocculibacter collagenilyticus]
MQHINFPLSLNNEWTSDYARFELSPNLADWLLHTGSLTERLKASCDVFYVELLGQHQIQLSNNMQKLLDCDDEQACLREVILRCDDKPIVYAQSLFPLSSLTGEQQRLAHLGHQPLGEVLFQDPSMQRQPFELATFDNTSAVAKLSNMLGHTAVQPMFGRRSVFRVNHKPILVNEIFLPLSTAYQ